MTLATDSHSQKPGRGIFMLLLAALFATELAVMELFSAWFPRIGRIPAALADSLSLVLLLIWPLWYLVGQLRGRGMVRGGRSEAVLQWQLLGRLLAVIFLVNGVLMLLQPQLWTGADRPLGNLLDAAMVTIIAAPFLWLLTGRGRAAGRADNLPGLIGTPLGIYVLLLLSVFCADLLQEIIMPWVLPGALYLSWQISDAIFTTLLTAPVFWLLVARPLSRSLASERSRSLAIHNQLLDAVVTTDADGIIRSVNPAAESIFGYRAWEVVDHSVSLLFAAADPVFADLSRDNGSFGNAGSIPFREIVGRRSDGTQLTMEVSLSPIVQGDQRQYLLVMRDISGRKEAAQALRESETRFREIFQQSEDAIVFFKPGSCSIIDVNATMLDLFGFSKEELFREGIDLLAAGSDLERLRRMIREVSRGSSSQLDTFSARRRVGGDFIVSMRCKVMTLQGIDIIYCTFRDVTDRIRMEEEAREIQAKLIQANKMTSLGLLVSGVAHEINNPNNFILANARLLARSWEDARKVLREYVAENGEVYLGGVPFAQLDSSSAELFDGIIDGSARINAIVNNLKGFARQELDVAGSPFDLNQVATSAITILRHELVRYTEHFKVDLATDLPPAIGSAQQIAQVVINLLMNACQALPAKSHGIWLVTARAADSDEVLLSVRDEGSGMSAEASRRIMEPFFTTKLDAGGTGLGLSICQSIVREHHGTLEFTSEPGEGSTFTVRLPAAAQRNPSHAANDPQ